VALLLVYAQDLPLLAVTPEKNISRKRANLPSNGVHSSLFSILAMLVQRTMLYLL
jgi:hypothetical protein